MCYVVYADVLFLYHVLIDLALFFMMQTILGQTIRITRTVLLAILMAALSTGVFIVTISNRTLYYILYVTSYFFMTYFFTKSSSQHTAMSVTLLAMIVSCVWLAGIMQLFYRSQNKVLHNPVFYIACAGSVLLCRMVRFLCNLHIRQKKDYMIELIFPDQTICAKAFVDTGNHLKNPYTKQPAIIINYRLLKSCLSEQNYEHLEQYHKTGKFPYLEINGNGTLTFFPLPYHTIGNRFSLMPAITVPEIVYRKEHVTLHAVTAGISREEFLENRYEVILNEKLQPIKEEPA